MKTINIEIPSGHEIDQENSNLSEGKIVFKELRLFNRNRKAFDVMKKPKTKLKSWSYYKYVKGAKAVTASGVEVIEINISEHSNYLFEGRIATDPKLKLYWNSNGKAHGNNPDNDLRIEVKLTFWERLWNF